MLSENYLLLALVFLLGASIASFISVYVERGDQDKFFSKKNRSICKNCLRKLNYFELIPVFSYIFLRGKCRTCKTEIPRKLFLGELLLGVWFASTFIYFIPTHSILFYAEVALSWLLGSIFFLLVLEDLENMEVSQKYLHIFAAIGILMALVNFNLAGNIYEILLPLLIFSPFWIIYFINHDWIGEADPYIFTALGLFFGTQFSISLFLYSVWFGAIYGIFYLLFINKKFERNIAIPFIPIIFFSTLFIIIFNYHIIQISDILFVNEILFK
jgi:prepilin signal peptidase PulO-like enzyme (type II secretory pathway)